MVHKSVLLPGKCLKLDPAGINKQFGLYLVFAGYNSVEMISFITKRHTFTGTVKALLNGTAVVLPFTCSCRFKFPSPIMWVTQCRTLKMVGKLWIA